MIEFQNVSKRYGGQEVLRSAAFRVNRGERVGVVGPNGAGKSTLFGLITSELAPDAGEVLVPRDARIGYLRQQLGALDAGQNLLEYAEHALPDLRNIQREMETIEHRLEANGRGADPADLRRLGELQTQFEHRGGYEIRGRAQEALGGLGFATAAFHQPFAAFSGGWQMRAELARVLVAQPDTLLLDEPSNYLDLPAVEWLQRYLKGFAGTLLLISHDRYLLNTLTSRTLEVNAATVTSYAGNQAWYAQQRVQRQDQLASAHKNQDRRRQQVERFIERFRAKNTKSSQVQSRIKMLEKMETVELPAGLMRRGTIRLAAPPPSGAEVMRLEQAGLTYDGQRWVLQGVDLRVMRGEKIALVGLNGLGKTTLLRVLAGLLPLSAGARVLGHKAVVGYQSQEFADTMEPTATVFATVKQAAPEAADQYVRTLLGGFGFSGPAVEKKVAVLSGGEKIRLAFARMLAQPPNFLLLDEPTTHLDLDAREALEDALAGYEGTLCFVSHDVEFVRRVATSILAMSPPGVTRFAGGYDYYKDKLAEVAAATPCAAPADGAPDRKAQKRERALKRQADSAARRQLESAVKKAETDMAALEQEQATLAASLAGAGPGTDFAAVNRRLQELHAEMSAVTAAWETSALALEDFLSKLT